MSLSRLEAISRFWRELEGYVVAPFLLREGPTLTHYEIHSEIPSYRYRRCVYNYADLLGCTKPTGKEQVEALAEVLLHAGATLPARQAQVLLLSGLLDYWLTHQEHQYSLGQLVDRPQFDFLASYFSELRFPLTFVQTAVQITYHLSCHERAGRRVYTVAPVLAEMLRHTELRGLYTSDLHLPFEAIYIQIPPELGLRVWNKETKWHKLIGAYVVEDVSSVTASDLSERPGRGWRIGLIGEAKSDPLDDAVTYFRVNLADDSDGKPRRVDDCLDEDQHLLEEALKRNLVDGFDHMVSEWRAIFTWVMNVVLYCTWTEPGEHIIANPEAAKLWQQIEKHPKGMKRSLLTRKFNQLVPQRRILLGGKVTVDRHLVADAGAEGAAAGRKQQVRSRVAGHYRRQACGPQWRDHRVIWIQPFWRGPDDGPIKTTKHEVR